MSLSRERVARRGIGAIEPCHVYLANQGLTVHRLRINSV